LSYFLLLFLHSRQICNSCCTRTPAFATDYASSFAKASDVKERFVGQRKLRLSKPAPARLTNPAPTLLTTLARDAA